MIYTNSIDIDVNRCLCIHSISQLIDITLQSLLYQRQIIPEPVSTLSKSDSHISQQFRIVYEKVTKILQNTFRSPNAKIISEFIILFGSAPYLPKEIYRIKCRNANEDELINEIDNEKNKSEEVKCEELSAKEKRLIFSAIALSKTAVDHFESCPAPGKTDKVFMFIKATNKLQTLSEGLNEDLSFELPDNMQRRRIIHQLRIELKSPHKEILKEDMKEENNKEIDENIIWYRILPFFTNLN
ncbi:hypothetical protein Mgra_00002355 [Meloidogyne graminicola]|uniref:Uncharacterized protein n=1 Tax=Meloidogyne graminicola TaxID=189291 RepID=A0A8S9ZWY2_9BILA|nr:hypothetical protein Mgra_00002355 [Meloidogyne graminicola]